MARVGKITALSVPILIALLLGAWTWFNYKATEDTETRGATRAATHTATFNSHIAPIVFKHCASCHRPGESAPFSLLSYGDVKRRAEQIVDIVESRFMPPWLPEPGYGDFVHSRRLSDAQISVFRRWFADGAIEGDPLQLPPVPQWPKGWQLGAPDLVVRMEEPYTLPAAGTDVFRNFVIPVSLPRSRYVKSVDIQPGNPKVIHHAVLAIDRTGSSRQRDAQEPGGGFGGMDMAEALPPDGLFVGWTPGKVPLPGSDDLSWRLTDNTDLVLQLHMLPTGKPEVIQPTIGLYFADGPPKQRYATILLRNDEIDIPAGATDYEVEDTFMLPVDLQMIGVYPHAHYLGKEVQAFATLPDGSKQWLIRIKDWDFNWQDDYRYSSPLHLPKGTTLTMRYTYDNSAGNVRNPHNPPRRVIVGNRSTDEMATLTLTTLPANRDDWDALTESFLRHRIRQDPSAWDAYTALGSIYNRQGKRGLAVAQFKRSLELNPHAVATHNNLGLVLLGQGKLPEAAACYERAIELAPQMAPAHYNMSLVQIRMGNLGKAAEHLQDAIRIEPHDANAHGMLGSVRAKQGKLREAVTHFERAIELDSGLADAHYNLGLAHGRLGELGKAAANYAHALSIQPSDPGAHYELGSVLEKQGKLTDAVVQFQQAVRLRPDFAEAHRKLGDLFVKQRELKRAVAQYREALALRPDLLKAANGLAWILSTSKDPSIRDGNEAVRWAEQCATAVSYQHPGVLDTLAAAYAEAGRFEEAIRTAKKALGLARSQGRERLVQPLEQRLQLYETRQPFRSNTSP